MAVHEAAGLDEGNRGQRAVGDVRVQVRRVLDVGLADAGVRHDRRVVLERVADVAVLVRVGDGSAEKFVEPAAP